MLKSIVKEVVRNVVRIEVNKRTNETQKIAIDVIASIFRK